MEHVVLVDPQDRDTGIADKLAAHRQGLLHRAVSVFILDPDDRLLLQRRAPGKYHSPGLWSNTCCGHPRPGEAPFDAARRRLREEMGITADLAPLLRFTYRADLAGGLIEHEIDHVFLGRYEGSPSPSREEVREWRWAPLDALEAELRDDPSRFTAWLPLLLPEVRARLATTHEFLDHTSETVLRVRGPSQAAVLAEAARALGRLERAGIPLAGGERQRDVEVEALDDAGLLVDFLNEVILYSETDRFAPADVEVRITGPHRLHAVLRGPALEVAPSGAKAVTRHAARLEPHASGWIGEVTIDV